MSGTVQPSEQGRWRGQRGRGSRGPTRAPLHPTMPPPGEIPALTPTEEDEMPQQESSGNPNPPADPSK